jgi:hypothetical protein
MFRETKTQAHGSILQREEPDERREWITSTRNHLQSNGVWALATRDVTKAQYASSEDELKAAIEAEDSEEAWQVVRHIPGMDSLSKPGQQLRLGIMDTQWRAWLVTGLKPSDGERVKDLKTTKAVWEWIKAEPSGISTDERVEDVEAKLKAPIAGDEDVRTYAERLDRHWEELVELGEADPDTFAKLRLFKKGIRDYRQIRDRTKYRNFAGLQRFRTCEVAQLSS